MSFNIKILNIDVYKVTKNLKLNVLDFSLKGFYSTPLTMPIQSLMRQPL